MSWYSKLENIQPNSSMLRELITAVERLPDLAEWEPDDINANLHELVGIGLNVWGTLPYQGTEALYNHISSRLKLGEPPSVQVMSELGAAALCMSIGCMKGEHLKEGNGRTADWRLEEINGKIFDLEVTKAAPKPKLMELQNEAMNIGNELARDYPGKDIAVHIIDISDEKEVRKLKESISKNVEGGIIESPGSWHVDLKPSQYEKDVVVQLSQTDSPEWWPTNMVRCVSSCGQTNSNTQSQCVIYYGVPYDSYLNPLQRKAERPQGDPNLPFLIAIDVADLPDGLNEIPRAAAQLLPFWDDVSGALLFVPGLYAGEEDKIGWVWKLLINGKARIPLPKFRGIPENSNGRQLETWYSLGLLHVE